MMSASKYPFLAIAIACLALPAAATEVHKWVDANGVTHYADAPPAADAAAVTRIDVTIESGADGKDDYYSIANQWARMHRERLERERIALEKARLEAARQAQRTEVVYVEKPAEERHYSIRPFPGYRYHRADHRGSHHHIGRYRGHPRHLKPGRQPVNNAGLGFYKHVQ